MAKIDREARLRAERQAAEAASANRRVLDEQASAHAGQLADARSLIPSALARLTTERPDEAQSFKLRRSLREGLSGHRGGWRIGSMVGGLGHGESGELGVYLLSSGRIVFGGHPNMNVTSQDVDLFRDDQVEHIVKSLRGIVGEEG